MSTAISICSAALLMLGADEITSFDETSREAKLCASLYPTTRDELLQSYPWRFALGQATLGQLTSNPLFGYQYAYQLPADTLRVIAVEDGAPYRLYENRLYCDSPAVRIVYLFRPTEERLPAFFVRTLELKMAEILAVALHEDLNKSRMMEQKARDQMVRARSTDAQQQTPAEPMFGNFSLVTARG